MHLDESQLDRYVSTLQAANQLGILVEEIQQLVYDGKIQAAIMPDNTVGISQRSLNQLLPKEKLPEYKEFLELKGVPISNADACRKYTINPPTLTRWMKRGLVKRLGKDGRKTLLDEADVAYCAKIYDRNRGQGKWVFNGSGHPVTK